MTTFASNANNFYTPDVSAMNAFQRQAFLPSNAQGGEIGGLATGDNGLTAAQEHAAWRSANPGEGPHSGSFAGQQAARQQQAQQAQEADSNARWNAYYAAQQRANAQGGQ
jgi:hypothetical protein